MEEKMKNGCKLAFVYLQKVINQISFTAKFKNKGIR